MFGFPCLSLRQDVPLLEPEISLLWGDPDVTAISVDSRPYIPRPRPRHGRGGGPYGVLCLLAMALAVRWARSSRQRPEPLAVSLDTLGAYRDKVSPWWLTVCSPVFLRPRAWAAWLRCPGLARFLPSPGCECGCALLRVGPG
jgi:hypothetical protein